MHINVTLLQANGLSLSKFHRSKPFIGNDMLNQNPVIIINFRVHQDDSLVTLCLKSLEKCRRNCIHINALKITYVTFQELSSGFSFTFEKCRIIMLTFTIKLLYIIYWFLSSFRPQINK
jgi:hypothetical protein